MEQREKSIDTNTPQKIGDSSMSSQDPEYSQTFTAGFNEAPKVKISPH